MSIALHLYLQMNVADILCLLQELMIVHKDCRYRFMTIFKCTVMAKFSPMYNSADYNAVTSTCTRAEFVLYILKLLTSPIDCS